MKALVILFLCIAAPLTGWTKTYVSSSSDVDLCVGYSSGAASVDLQPADDVTINGFDFDFRQRVLQIPVELESLQAFNISPAISNIYNIEPVLGTLELHPNGDLYYEGQLIGSSSLEQACAKQQGKPIFGREKEIIEGDAPHE